MSLLSGRSPLCETPEEELASSITHGIGATLSIAALVVMIVMAEGPLGVVSAAIFGASLTILYLSSTLYHLFTGVRVKAFFQLMDHACIYLLIAGSYTPITLLTLRGGWGWSLFGVVWGLALVGILVKALTRGRNDHWISTALYVAMGWIVVIAGKPLLASLDTGGIALLVAGGLCYSLGVIFFVWERLKYNHAIWHLFVMAGSACHVIAMMIYVI